MTGRYPIFAHLLLTLLLVSCGSESDDAAVTAGRDSGPGDRKDDESVFRHADAEAYFARHIQPHLEFCRGCHLPGGEGDVANGRLLRLSDSRNDDYANYYLAWEALGKGVSDNPILARTADLETEPSGGIGVWPEGSAAYNTSRHLFSCWNATQACDELMAAELAADSVSINPPDCEANDCVTLGGFTPPFAEPRITLGGNRTEDYCEFAADGITQNCKPSAVHIALLGDGRLMYYNGLEGSENTGGTPGTDLALKNDQSRLLTIEGDTAHWAWPTPVDGLDYNDKLNSGDSAWFCSDLSNMPDGRILVTGGTDYLVGGFLTGYTEGSTEPPEELSLPGAFGGIRNTGLFNPETDNWEKTGSMNWARWYPTTMAMPDGSVYVASGVEKLIFPVYPDKPQYSGRNVVQSETYDPHTGSWQENGPAAERSLPLYPKMHLLPNGQILYNAAGEAYNPAGQAYDQALWNVVATYDPDSRTWTDLAYAGLPWRMNEIGLEQLVSGLNPTNPEAAAMLQQSFSGFMGKLIEDPAAIFSPMQEAGFDPETLLGAGFRGSTFSLMMPLVPDENGLYTKAEFLTAGGVLGAPFLTSPGSYFAVSLSRMDTIDMNNGGMRYSSRLTGPLNAPRWFGTALLLPTGEAMVFSGADRDEVLYPESGEPNRVTELFDPKTETWRTMATQGRPRTYHNTALLMPDGRVLVGGHAPLPSSDPDQLKHDPTFELYSPPYMFRQRPKITEAPDSLTPDSRISLSSPQAMEIESVMLVRKTAMTHVVDAEQRSVVLSIISRGMQNLEIRIPGPNVVPAGDYMLFVNRRDSDGMLVPSVSVQLPVLLSGT